ncbi:hemicentin-2 [Ixodes scapularis]|uniref:hemicentin-2 n=1 Tax=Ixodes scapularis TaxID=6945 RepID=UPI001A9D8882|nr:hemicentin-2 [Ixodes scapularis]
MSEALDNNDRDPSSDFADLDEQPQLQVRVVSPIRMEPLPAFQVADAGATVSVVCKVLAKPNPRVSWFVDGVPLNVSEQHLRRSSLSRDRGSDVEDAVLTIRDVSPNDRNVYTCRAEHHQCRSVATETSTRLFVWAQSIHTNERFPGSGLLVKPYDDTLELSCSPAANESSADFDWDKDGARLNASQGVTVSDDTTSLTIRHPTQANAGNYSCKKRGTTETATIEVRYKVTCVIDRELSSPEPSYWMADEGARLVAKTTGVPTPQVSWLKDGKLLREDGKRILFEDVHNTTRGGLIIRQVVDGDRGVYTCIASNGPDTDKEDVMVRVRSRYAPLVPFVGIVIQVVVLLTIIYVTETRRIRKEAEREAAAEQRRAQREPSIVTDKKDD